MPLTCLLQVDNSFLCVPKITIRFYIINLLAWTFNWVHVFSESSLGLLFHQNIVWNLLTFKVNHLIAGLRFRKIGEHINLEARITPISFKDGKLDGATSTWIGNDKTQGSYENRRTRVSLISPNVPTKYLGKNSIDSKNNQVSKVWFKKNWHYLQ